MRNPKTTIRCNTTKITKDELVNRLTAQGFTVENGVYAKDALYLSGYDFLEKIPEFAEGLFQVQDESSMLVAELAGLKKNDIVLQLIDGLRVYAMLSYQGICRNIFSAHGFP